MPPTRDRSDFKFCFSADGVPPSIFPREPLPNKRVEVVASDAGETCTDACKKKEMSCSHRCAEIGPPRPFAPPSRQPS